MSKRKLTTSVLCSYRVCLVAMKGKTTPIRIHIPQLEELRKIAAREDRSVAWIIRKMIDEGIERQKRKK